MTTTGMIRKAASRPEAHSHDVRVTSDDIRPSHPGQCFWCGGGRGDRHAPECATVVSLVEYDVMAQCEPLSNLWRKVGELKAYEPASWTDATCESYRDKYHHLDGVVFTEPVFCLNRPLRFVVRAREAVTLSAWSAWGPWWRLVRRSWSGVPGYDPRNP
jgi:hypothetical protein